ncbi:hypothetical protein LX99_04787 [Mucilaginibacter oryzae]|uniref:Uncharacterized protein n=1 Tax=Mucilaginibacter oryzae TaxID=468058 RepID=A0A316GWC3_9SPHI|nr:DUF6527 family protein [Mucilaginibacter oryzae]PWK68263.1 hypothetical protein LX99_04787 [Mucilaginibacter oryzae]
MKTVQHQFVEYVPEFEQVQEGILYISMPFATAVHRCMCGCGMEVVTPLSPKDWKLTFDGKVVTLNPSIGNWKFKCGSHYWIKKSVVVFDKKYTGGTRSKEIKPKNLKSQKALITSKVKSFKIFRQKTR